jgi:hypothetical protein
MAQGSAPGGGIYVGAAEWPGAGGGMEQWFLTLSFPEVETAPAVVFQVQRCVGLADRPPNHKLMTWPLPKGPANNKWHRLQFDVHPGGVSASRDEGRPVTLGLGDLGQRLKNLSRMPPEAPDHPPAAMLLHGGLGLFNKDATTQFRNVVVEPLP